MSTSLSDIFTTAKNIVVAINALASNYLSVQGSQNFAGLTAPTVVSTSGGRVARISVTVAGSAPGLVYDGASLTALSKPLAVIADTVGVYEVNLPTNFGLVVIPGSGQTVAGSYSVDPP